MPEDTGGPLCTRIGGCLTNTLQAFNGVAVEITMASLKLIWLMCDCLTLTISPALYLCDIEVAYPFGIVR